MSHSVLNHIKNTFYPTLDICQAKDTKGQTFTHLLLKAWRPKFTEENLDCHLKKFTDTEKEYSGGRSAIAD